MHISGQCHCGRIRYEAEIDAEAVGICHCTDCQRLTGSAFRVTVAAPRTNIRLLEGEPKRYVKRGDNGEIRNQDFCGHCGSPLFTSGDGERSDPWGIRLGTIDQRQDLTPREQIWCRSALPWLHTLETLPSSEAD